MAPPQYDNSGGAYIIISAFFDSNIQSKGGAFLWNALISFRL